MTIALWVVGYLLLGCASCGALIAWNRASGGGSSDGVEVAAIIAIPFWPVVLPATVAIVGGGHLGERVRNQRKERARLRAIEEREQERLLREAGL